jgi:hypothetical protein
VLALKEDDLVTAAILREEWGCPGPDRAAAERFRDKALMTGLVTAAGHRAPPFDLVRDAGTVTAFAAAHGWPVVVKPRAAHSSKGVVKLDGPTPLDLDGGLIVQQYNPHPIYYVDGVLRDGGLGPWTASRYLNSCLGYRTGGHVGAVEEDDPALLAAIERETLRFLAALTDGPLVFHLELFVEPGADGPVCSFLEVGARAGGAEIPFLWRQVHGYDLMHAVAAVQLGLAPPPPPAPAGPREVAGLLLVPAPAERPCRITAVTSMLGRTPGPYAEIVPPVGAVLPAGDSVFEHAAGRFRFRGRSTAEVERAILTTLADFHVTGAAA